MTNNRQKVESAIEVINVGKCYRKFHRKRDYAKQLINREGATYYHENWVLKDISFNLGRQESMGIIGRNGCGKSTLLQLICGTLKPTKGIIRTNGRIGALLELGSGFSPEFTGIENIYLNGILLGLTRREVDERMDNILGFADIGDKATETLNTYSSGMIVRLAFSIIANIDADILIIDEALAVGDAYFTQKCMRYIQRYREEKSLLFVSHDANSIMNLCDRAIYLEEGLVKNNGTPKQVMSMYTKDLQKDMAEDIRKENIVQIKGDTCEQREQIDAAESVDEYQRRWQDFRLESKRLSDITGKIEIIKNDDKYTSEESFGGKKAEIKKISIRHMESNELDSSNIIGGEVIVLQIAIATKEKIEEPIVGFIVKDHRGQTILGDNTRNMMKGENKRELGKNKNIKVEFVFTIPLLKAGNYSISGSIASGNQERHEIIHWRNDALILRSSCSSVAAGVAGIAMHSVKIMTEEN